MLKKDATIYWVVLNSEDWQVSHVIPPVKQRSGRSDNLRAPPGCPLVTEVPWKGLPCLEKNPGRIKHHYLRNTAVQSCVHSGHPWVSTSPHLPGRATELQGGHGGSLWNAVTIRMNLQEDVKRIANGETGDGQEERMFDHCGSHSSPACRLDLNSPFTLEDAGSVAGYALTI